MTKPNQRLDSISNSHVGRDFEAIAATILAGQGIMVRKNFRVDVGVAGVLKQHAYDLGAENPPVLVECKSHKWTTGDNTPSAKMTVWNEAMYYFMVATSKYRKILFVLRDERKRNGETLASYYIRTYEHLIPPGVEIWEYSEKTQTADQIYPR